VMLPAGCSIQISHASTSDKDKLKEAEDALKNPAWTDAQKIEQWRSNLEFRTYAYQGDPRASGEVILSAPLHDVREELIWIEIVLIAAPGGSLPMLSELRVLYPGATLIEHLPAIYRSGELESGNFTRALVGVLEAGTQDLDDRIGKLGRKIDPKFADSDWLDYVAGWLGLPWDNSLSVDQKRRIVSRGAAIARGYSTRSGLEELLDCLIPDTPRRFRITDMTAQFGLATIAGTECEGSRLPAVLAGLPATATEIGNKAVIGKARLPCGEPGLDAAGLNGRIRIDIAATAEERAAWSPWIERLVETMVPATARTKLRWLGPGQFRGDRLEEDSKIIDETPARLGSEAITGASRLGGRSRTTLPNRLTRNSTLQ
jgi:phage tail-like protein